ncbi:MAG: hypothetical protein WBA29_04870 [Xanthobacteraceae bacterium]
MTIMSPFWIAAATAETINRLATMWFWGMIVPMATPELKPIAGK